MEEEASEETEEEEEEDEGEVKVEVKVRSGRENGVLRANEFYTIAPVRITSLYWQIIEHKVAAEI